MPSRSPGTLRLLSRPSMFLLHVPAAAATIAAVMLGNWQVDSWEADRRAEAAKLVDADPVPLADVMGPDDPFPAAAGRPVTVPGTWSPEETVYVQDKQYDGNDGYWVVTPLLTCGTTADGCAEPVSLPVAVGWTDDIAAVQPPAGAAEITGWLQPGDGPGAADENPDDDVLTSLRIAELVQRSDRDLYGAYAMLDEPAETRGDLKPLTPENLPEPDSFTALRNLLYGVEWYLFAGFAVFLWWRWSKDEVDRARRQADADAGTDGAGPDGSVNPVSGHTEDDEARSVPRIPSQP
jgi:surfeit locus 1 family protein